MTTFFLLLILIQHFQLASYTTFVPSLAQLQRISMIGSWEVIQSFLQCPLHLIFTLHWPLQSVHLLFSEEDSWRCFPFLLGSVLLCGLQGPQQVSYKCDFSRKVLSNNMNRETDTIHSHCFSTHFFIFFEPIAKWQPQSSLLRMQTRIKYKESSMLSGPILNISISRHVIQAEQCHYYKVLFII